MRFNVVVKAITAAALMLLATASSALALSVQVAAPTGPVPEDLAASITISGDAGAGHRLFVRTRVAGGAPCAAVQQDDNGNSLFYSETVTGNFSKVGSRVFSEPGTILVCMWLQTSPGSDTAALATSANVTIRQPTTTLSLTAPGATGPNAPLQVTATYQAEVSRRLFIRVQPSGAAGCATVQKNDSGNSITYSETITGGPKTYTQTLTTGNPGGYLLCAYVQEDSGEETAELTTSFTYTVPKVNTSLSLRARAVRGGYSVSGTLSSRQSASRIVIERKSGSKWKKIKAFSTNYNGSYSGYVYTKKKATIRARFSATSYYNGCTSGKKSITPGRRR